MVNINNTTNTPSTSPHDHPQASPKDLVLSVIRSIIATATGSVDSRISKTASSDLRSSSSNEHLAQTSGYNNLPPELKFEVIKYLNHKSAINLAKTSKANSDKAFLEPFNVKAFSKEEVEAMVAETKEKFMGYKNISLPSCTTDEQLSSLMSKGYLKAAQFLNLLDCSGLSLDLLKECKLLPNMREDGVLHFSLLDFSSLDLTNPKVPRITESGLAILRGLNFSQLDLSGANLTP